MHFSMPSLEVVPYYPSDKLGKKYLGIVQVGDVNHRDLGFFLGRELKSWIIGMEINFPY